MLVTAQFSHMQTSGFLISIISRYYITVSDHDLLKIYSQMAEMTTCIVFSKYFDYEQMGSKVA